MKVNKIIAGIMAVCVIGCGVPYVNAVTENNSAITASAIYYTQGTYENLTYNNYGDYIEIYGCDKSATEVVIPSEIEGVPVTRIGYGAFRKCSSLTSIEIPDCVTSIGESAFYKTLWLEEKQKENPLVIINNILIDGHTCTGDVVIPDSVTSIVGSAFYGCSGLTSVTISNNVTSIKEWTFSSCSSLTSVIIPDSVTSIGSRAFGGCEKLTSITIPDSVEEIYNSAFEFCRGLKEVKLSDSLKVIQHNAFSSCDNLREIMIPESVSSIGKEAFYNCSLLNKVTILNPDCNINDSPTTFANAYYTSIDTTGNQTSRYAFIGAIYGYENSTAQAYAKKNSYNFKVIKQENIAGDMNGDNSVSIADAVFLQNYILGGQELTEEQFKNADLTGDGFVDCFDMVLLRKQIINK